MAGHNHSNYSMASDYHHGSNAALDTSHTNSMIDFVESETFRPFIIPIIGLLLGAGMMAVPKVATYGKLVLYFGAQSFMNIFMGWVFRTHVTVPKGEQGLKEDLHGCPVGFALTAMQQLVSFFCFLILYAALYATPYRIVPKKITTMKEVGSIIIFGCVFAMNIALNNFSLAYISIAVNLIIRSCLPLSTFLSQQALAAWGLGSSKPFKYLDVGLMAAGVGFACMFTIAKIAGSNASHHGASDQGKQVMGVIMCLLSLLCGSVNLALAGVLGEMKMSVYDTVAYMSVPAFFFLMPFCFVPKEVPGEWPTVLGVDSASDFTILMKTRIIAPSTFMLFVLSGIFSFIYNIIQFTIVHTLSPSATAFGGNFNKAALVFLTLILPFLQVHALPGMPWIAMIWLAVIGNVASFSYYSYLQVLAKREKEEAEKSKTGDVEKEAHAAMLDTQSKNAE